MNSNKNNKKKNSNNRLKKKNSNNRLKKKTMLKMEYKNNNKSKKINKNNKLIKRMKIRQNRLNKITMLKKKKPIYKNYTISMLQLLMVKNIIFLFYKF